MHPDDALYRLADLCIAAENLTGDDQNRVRAQAYKLAVAVARARLADTVIPFPARGRPHPDQPNGAA